MIAITLTAIGALLTMVSAFAALARSSRPGTSTVPTTAGVVAGILLVAVGMTLSLS